MVKDPSTGKRVSKEHAPFECEVFNAPEPRIVAEEIFEVAKSRKEIVGWSTSRQAPKMKRRLLTGILKCASCGGALTVTSADRSGPRVICSRYRESGDYSNSGRSYTEKIERDVVDRLRVLFSETSTMDAYIEEYRAESKRIATERRGSRAAKETTLADIQQRIARVVDRISRGQIDDDEIEAIMPVLRRERGALKADLAAEEPPTKIIELCPKAIDRFKEDFAQLADILKDRDGEIPIELHKALRGVVSQVIVYPYTAREEYYYEIKEWLSGLASPELSAVPMVAGGRVELPTLGL